MLQKRHIQQLTILGYLTAGLLGILLIISAVERKQENRVSNVIIDIGALPDGSVLITKADILLLIDRSFGFPLNSQPIREVNMERLERVLEEDPFVLDAEAFIDANDQIFINVVQREPVLRVIDNNDLNYYLDEGGIKMETSIHASPHVLVLTGNLPPYTSDFLEPEKEHLLKDLFYLGEMIRRDEFLDPLIEQIHVSTRNEVTLVPKIGQQKIFFGRVREEEDKLRRLKIYYQEAVPYQGWRKYRSLDLRYKGQVVAKR